MRPYSLRCAEGRGVLHDDNECCRCVGVIITSFIDEVTLAPFRRTSSEDGQYLASRSLRAADGADRVVAG